MNITPTKKKNETNMRNMEQRAPFMFKGVKTIPHVFQKNKSKKYSNPLWKMWICHRYYKNLKEIFYIKKKLIQNQTK